MKKDLSYKRKSYEKKNICFTDLKKDPFKQFSDWYVQAENSDLIEEANAMTISTIDLDGFPHARVVLLKKYTEEGFIFFTNYNSNKGISLNENNKTCLSFFWPSLEQQIIIKGHAEKISEDESNQYFQTRPRGSQLSAWLSQQSSSIDIEKDLQIDLQKLEIDFKEKTLTRPLHWGGYLVKPKEIEFWQGRPNRLHDRIRYILQTDDNWNIERLAP